MTERLISVTIQWSDPDLTTGARTLLGVTPITRNADDSDPMPVFVPVAAMNPQLVAALQTSAFPGLLAARAAQVAVLEPPEQRAARLQEQAVAATAALNADIAAKTAQLAAIDAELAAKAAQVNQP